MFLAIGMCFVHLLWCGSACQHKSIVKLSLLLRCQHVSVHKQGLSVLNVKCHQVFTEVDIVYFNFCTRIDLKQNDTEKNQKFHKCLNLSYQDYNSNFQEDQTVETT